MKDPGRVETILFTLKKGITAADSGPACTEKSGGLFDCAVPARRAHQHRSDYSRLAQGNGVGASTLNIAGAQ